MFIPKEYDSIRIRLNDIKMATSNFSDSNRIGRGGFGNVYKGELVHSGRLVMVAVKRLHFNPIYGQGASEFLEEISVLFNYKHENIVSLLGFSEEDGENILVYEYLPNKSLDKHLKSTNLPWIDRLKILIGAARGLEHLHNPHGTKPRVIHRDIKSSNILLDTKWNAKISDFGLSRIVSANKKFPYIPSPHVGTIGYCDPQYVDKGILTKEVDVYSFGVVQFEVLCGRLCFEKPNLLEQVQRCYNEKKIHTIVFDCLKDQISPKSLAKFSTIAYKCLERDRDKRPPLSEILKQLKVALARQAGYNIWKERRLNSHTLSTVAKNTRIYNSGAVRFAKKSGRKIRGGIGFCRRN